MSSHLLFIDCGTIDYSSLHASRQEAWSALVRFVDDNWNSMAANHQAPAGPEARVAAFFEATGWFYLIATMTIA